MSNTTTSSALLSIPVLAISGEDGIAFSGGSEYALHHYHHHSLNTTTSTPPCLGRQSSSQSIKHIRSLLKPYHNRLRSQKEGSSTAATSPTNPGVVVSDPTADLLAQFGSCASTATLTSASSITTSSPFSPITPLSSTAGYFQTAETLLSFQRHALYNCPPQAPPPPQRRSSLRPNGLLTPVSTTPANQAPTTANVANLAIPVFSEEQGKTRPSSSPVVFSAEYLDARLSKKGDEAQPQQQESVYGTCAAFSAPSADILNLLKDFPYASAYVDVSSAPHQPPQTTSHRPQGQDSGVVAQAAPSASSSGREEEIRKQKYAVDLIETAIKTIHKIWPETQEPEREAVPGPVTSDGKLRASFVAQAVPPPPEHKATARLRRKPSAQQFTPESSPDSGRKKRKRGVDAVEEQASKRSCVGEAKEAHPTCPRVLTPPAEPKPEPTKAAVAQQSRHISLKLFVRELLRRSKTSCNTLEVALCYLDAIEETVKKLRDCLKLGIAFGTVAMAERGPYDEGMKDEGRIITAVEWMKQEAMKQEDDGMDVRGDWPNQQQHGGQEWDPTSPAEAPSSDKGSKATATIAPTQILATHPLLDARRTFLASLVLATKFIQDKAYSNKAWAKLSGLAGKEVGRCERALGGALQWRLWVGKDCGASSMRSRSPVVNEEGGESLCSGDSDSVVHGENDPLAKAFMEEASKKQKGGSGAVEHSAPAQLAPAEVVARLYGGETSRAGSAGRARTWHAPEKPQEGHASLLPLPTYTSASSSSAVSVASCATLLDQLSTFNLVTPLSQATVVDPHASFGLPFVHSPLSLESERFLDSLLKGGEECEVPQTVKIGEEGKNKTPVMSMATSFPNNEPLPSAGFMDQWQLHQAFPFTFTARPSKPLQFVQPPRLSIARQQVRSYSAGTILLHPQTAALRGSSTSTSPNSASTFSSPEVLTPVHSRAPTLVLDGVEQEWMKGREFQQCVDQLYCGGQFGSAIPVQM